MAASQLDEDFIRRCISLGAKGSRKLDFPFGAIVALNQRVISEKHNEALDKRAVYRHAEMLALVEAQRKLSASEIREATLYSSVEPCPMCSFAAQELGIKRVVFGLRSPLMGGYSRWKILQDVHINRAFPKTFGKPPEIIPDVLKEEVISGWRLWNAGHWERLISKGVFK